MAFTSSNHLYKNLRSNAIPPSLEEVEPQRLAALVARGTQVECGKLDALVKVAWWCKRQQRIPVAPPLAKGRTLPAMAAAIAPTAAVTRQVRV